MSAAKKEPKIYKPNKVGAIVIFLIFGGLGAFIIIAMWDALTNIILLIFILILTVPLPLLIVFAAAKRVEIDENYLRYFSFNKEEKVLLRTITKVEVSTVVDHPTIYIYTSSQDPELAINATALSKKQTDDILNTLKNSEARPQLWDAGGRIW